MPMPFCTGNGGDLVVIYFLQRHCVKNIRKQRQNLKDLLKEEDPFSPAINEEEQQKQSLSNLKLKFAWIEKRGL